MTDKTNLPAIPANHKSFQLMTTNAPDLSVDPNLAEEFNADDFEGYSETRDSLPIVTVRQKDVKDDKGNIEIPAGNFRMRDVVFDKTIDVDGQIGLVVAMLGDSPCRVFFRGLEDKQPACKSTDALKGIGDPGGVCSECKLNRFHPENDGKTICKEGRMILVYDFHHNGCYMLQLGPSGIKAYDGYKKLIRLLYPNVPFYMVKTRVTLGYELEPAPHYKPNFTPTKVGDMAVFEMLKEFRKQSKDLFAATIDKAVDTNADHETLDADAEVTFPDRPNKDDDDDLPL